ncbi:hypothetical protein WA026_013367 [Henosepilachna vigintioctopunctata]|uniref:Acyltransferase 3 domain-containing protein n=1 Tax=Henosepilachna vigintioctopunctata TaxID=420089 RepID=A0AAW1VDY0_9CUCU
MATNTGGILKKFLEWEPLVFLGNITYSVYMFHFMIIFGKIIFWSNMVEHSNLFYLENLTMDIVLSFAFGMLMYIILEHPLGQLQKILLPQIKTKGIVSKNTQ